MSIYDYNVMEMTGELSSLEVYKGQVVLIVNTASKCGFSKQFTGLEKLYQTYQNDGFVILGFPCNQFLGQELASDEETLNFCQKNYGVSFPMYSKVKVRGKEKEPLFDYLITSTNSKKIEWNFTKFLINQKGEVEGRYSSKTKPESLEKDIKNLLAQS